MTILRPLSADSVEIWESSPPGAPWPCTGVIFLDHEDNNND